MGLEDRELSHILEYGDRCEILKAIELLSIKLYQEGYQEGCSEGIEKGYDFRKQEEERD